MQTHNRGRRIPHTTGLFFMTKVEVLFFSVFPLETLLEFYIMIVSLSVFMYNILWILFFCEFDAEGFLRGYYIILYLPIILNVSAVDGQRWYIIYYYVYSVNTLLYAAYWQTDGYRQDWRQTTITHNPLLYRSDYSGIIRLMLFVLQQLLLNQTMQDCFPWRLNAISFGRNYCKKHIKCPNRHHSTP